MMMYLPILAQEATPTGGGGFGMFVPMIIIMVLFYFVLIRPQRQQQKKQDEMRKTLSVNDKVVTIGGIHGLVTGMTDRTVSVKVADGISVKFDRSAIASVTESKAKEQRSEESSDEENKEKPAVES